MVKDEEKVIEEETGPGLVVLTGEVGVGMKMPDGNVIELKNEDVGLAQVLAYMVQAISKIEKNIA